MSAEPGGLSGHLQFARSCGCAMGPSGAGGRQGPGPESEGAGGASRGRRGKAQFSRQEPQAPLRGSSHPHRAPVGGDAYLFESDAYEADLPAMNCSARFSSESRHEMGCPLTDLYAPAPSNQPRQRSSVGVSFAALVQPPHLLAAAASGHRAPAAASAEVEKQPSAATAWAAVDAP